MLIKPGAQTLPVPVKTINGLPSRLSQGNCIQTFHQHAFCPGLDFKIDCLTGRLQLLLEKSSTLMVDCLASSHCLDGSFQAGLDFNKAFAHGRFGHQKASTKRSFTTRSD